ncbi:MAG: hypothetical protein WCI72_00435 [archaeon]
MTLTKVTRLSISDGLGNLVSVKRGDKVELLTAEERVAIGRDKDLESAKEEIDSTKEFLQATGPYEISWMGIWPCGTKMLYFKMDQGGEPGTYARDFKKYNSEPSHQ